MAIGRGLNQRTPALPLPSDMTLCESFATNSGGSQGQTRDCLTLLYGPSVGSEWHMVRTHSNIF